MRPVEAQVRPKHSCEYAVVYTKLRLSINMTSFVYTFHSISGPIGAKLPLFFMALCLDQTQI